NGNDFAVVRYNTDGTLDTTFGSNGELLVDLGSPNDFANGVTFDANGRLLVIGVTFNAANNTNDLGLVRLMQPTQETDYPDVAGYTVAVNDVIPQVSLSGPAQVDEGSSYSLNLGAVVDPGIDPVTSGTVSWGDGSTTPVAAADLAAGSVLNHTYADDG